MSIRVMSHVWENSKQSGSALVLLLAIADFANDDGMAWPAIGTLAKKIRMSERYVHRLVRDMVTAGEMRVEYKAGKNGTNQYWINLHPEPECTVNAGSVNPEPQFSETLNYRPPEPSVNHQEPSKTRRVPKPKTVRPRNEMFDAVLEVCGANEKLNGPTIGKVAAELAGAGYTVADVRAFGKDWWTWKDRTKPPTVWKLRDGISQIRAVLTQGRSGGVRVLAEEV